MSNITLEGDADMKSLVDLLEHLLLDCGRRSGAPVSRDVATLRTRVEHEGDSFITITLPAFARDFERCLETRRVTPGMFLSFRKVYAGIPSFLKGFLCQVFGVDGLLLDKPSIDCIRSIRQICLFGKKIQRTCSLQRARDAVNGYAKCDNEVATSFPGIQAWYFRKVARILFAGLPLDEKSITDILVPRHGPGATREGISGNQKWNFRRWHERLEEVGFTYLRYGRASKWISTDDLDAWPDLVDPGCEEPSRVVLVPKTLKTPRVIAVEPVCMQYAQQGLLQLLVPMLEQHRLTAGHVNFTDQTVNQKLALQGSKDGNFATLDMAEASDRVSLAHVEMLLESVPDFRKWVLACRSTRAQLPTGDIIPLKKFASMGSALCFPMEAMVFYTTIIASRIRRAGRCPDAHLVYSYSRDVYVYGDDLIVPADEAPAICDDLEAFGFKVNRNKSFWNGKFRESCGEDCYDYEKVTPVYLRHDTPAVRTDVSRIVSSIATVNQLYSAGYYSAAAALREAVEKVIGLLPMVSDDSPALGWNHYSEVVPRQRWNKDLQRFESLCWTPVSRKVDDPLDGDPALAKCFRIIGLSEFIDPEHLQTSVRPYSLTLRRRWVPSTSIIAR